MTTNELIAYAEAEIGRLGLGDSPTNCHGVIALPVEGDDGAIRLTDGVGLNAVVRTTDDIDTELEAMAGWYDEAE